MPVFDKDAASATTEELTIASWQAVAHLKNLFNLSDEEMQRVLGDMTSSTYYEGIKSQTVHLTEDTRQRVSLLLGIYKALRVLFDDTRQATTWINRENSLEPFNGAKPRDFLTTGALVDLKRVRAFLDFWTE